MAIFMFEEFMIRAMLGGIALAIVSGPVGCFILWKKLAYFGDTLAHSALLGVALAVFLNLNTVFAVFIIAVLVSFLLLFLRRTQIFSGDTALGILSHTALALGLILISVAAPGNFSLNALLFGDILAVTWIDVGTGFAIAATILLVLLLRWNSLIAHTFSSEIARVERIGSTKDEILFLVLCSGLIAIAMKITGILLISALLILPAATGRIFSRSPEQMAIMAVIFGIFSVIGGLIASLELDLPSGPSIIVAAATYLVSVFVISKLLSFR